MPDQNWGDLLGNTTKETTSPGSSLIDALIHWRSVDKHRLVGSEEKQKYASEVADELLEELRVSVDRYINKLKGK